MINLIVYYPLTLFIHSYNFITQVLYHCRIQMSRIVLFLILITSTFTLFNDSPETTFQIATAQPPRNVIMSPSGNKVMSWTNSSDFYIYSTNGSSICNSNSTGQIIKALWPQNRNPILLLFPGTQVIQVSQTTCQKQGTTWTLPYPSFQMAFSMRGTTSVIAFTFSRLFLLVLFAQVYEYNYDSRAQIRNYYISTNVNRTTTLKYTKNSRYLFMGQIFDGNGTLNIEIFDTNTTATANVTSIKNVSTLWSTMTFYEKGDNQITVLGYNATGGTAYICSIDSTGVVNLIYSSTNITKILPYPSANLILIQKFNSTSIDVIDYSGTLLQTLRFFTSSVTTLVDLSIGDNQLTVLNSLGYVAVSKYQSKVESAGFPGWAIVLIVVLVVVILFGVMGFVFRAKIKALIKGKKSDPLIDDKTEGNISAQSIQHAENLIKSKQQQNVSKYQQQQQQGSKYVPPPPLHPNHPNHPGYDPNNGIQRQHWENPPQQYNPNYPIQSQVRRQPAVNYPPGNYAYNSHYVNNPNFPAPLAPQQPVYRQQPQIQPQRHPSIFAVRRQQKPEMKDNDIMQKLIQQQIQKNDVLQAFQLQISELPQGDEKQSKIRNMEEIKANFIEEKKKYYQDLIRKEREQEELERENERKKLQEIQRLNMIRQQQQDMALKMEYERRLQQEEERRRIQEDIKRRQEERRALERRVHEEYLQKEREWQRMKQQRMNQYANQRGYNPPPYQNQSNMPYNPRPQQYQPPPYNNSQSHYNPPNPNYPPPPRVPQNINNGNLSQQQRQVKRNNNI